MAYAFSRGTWISEFKPSLVYKVSFKASQDYAVTLCLNPCPPHPTPPKKRQADCLERYIQASEGCVDHRSWLPKHSSGSWRSCPSHDCSNSLVNPAVTSTYSESGTRAVKPVTVDPRVLETEAHPGGAILVKAAYCCCCCCIHCCWKLGIIVAAKFQGFWLVKPRAIASKLRPGSFLASKAVATSP